MSCVKSWDFLLQIVGPLEITYNYSQLYHSEFHIYICLWECAIVYCTCPALCVCVLMSVALGRGTARCVCLSACPHSSPPGPRIDQLAWPNRRRGAWPGKVNMEKKRHILLPSWERSGREWEGDKGRARGEIETEIESSVHLLLSLQRRNW